MFGNVETLQKHLSEHSTVYLRTIIVLWAIMVILLVLMIDNPWLLAGIFLYEALP